MHHREIIVSLGRAIRTMITCRRRAVAAVICRRRTQGPAAMQPSAISGRLSFGSGANELHQGGFPGRPLGSDATDRIGCIRRAQGLRRRASGTILQRTPVLLVPRKPRIQAPALLLALALRLAPPLLLPLLGQLLVQIEPALLFLLSLALALHCAQAYSVLLAFARRRRLLLSPPPLRLFQIFLLPLSLSFLVTCLPLRPASHRKITDRTASPPPAPLPHPHLHPHGARRPT